MPIQLSFIMKFDLTNKSIFPDYDEFEKDYMSGQELHIAMKNFSRYILQRLTEYEKNKDNGTEL